MDVDELVWFLVGKKMKRRFFRWFSEEIGRLWKARRWKRDRSDDALLSLPTTTRAWPYILRQLEQVPVKRCRRPGRLPTRPYASIRFDTYLQNQNVIGPDAIMIDLLSIH